MKEMPSGFLLVDKPAGPTSHDVVDMVRRATGVRKVGHAGTLDPFASGLLLIAVGREATRRIGEFSGLDKEYEAVMHLGAVSDTMDGTGRITEVKCQMSNVKSAEMEKVLKKFTGRIRQIPPMYSAKKLGGRKLYELARRGETVEREAVPVTVRELELLSFEWPVARFRARVSSGTYIRALAHDLGQALGCGAYLEELRRTAIGPYRVEDALPASGLSAERVRERLFLP